jgi:hypothetical protein
MLSKCFRILDFVSGFLLNGMTILAPWMLGSTTESSIIILNSMGFLLGGTLIVKRVLAMFLQNEKTNVAIYRRSKNVMIWVMFLVGCLLIYIV